MEIRYKVENTVKDFAETTATCEVLQEKLDEEMRSVLVVINIHLLINYNINSLIIIYALNTNSNTSVRLLVY